MKLHFAVITLLAALSFSSAHDLVGISGKVIDASSSQPLSGARVILYRLGSELFNRDTIEKAEPGAQSHDPMSPVVAVLTGADGQFNFNVAPAHFSLHARSGGYLAWGDDIKSGKILNVKVGQKVSGLVIAMEMPVSISGHVIDPDIGKPVPGLYITPMAWVTMNGNRALVFVGDGGATDKNGAYKLKGLGPGEYILGVAQPHEDRILPGGTEDEFRSSASSAYLLSYYPGVERREQAEGVTLLPDAALNRIDFKLSKRRAAAIRGCIHSEGSPQSTADIDLGLTSIEVQGSTSMYKAIADKTMRVGDCFKVEGLSPGKYYLVASTKATDPGETQHAFATLDLDDRRVDNIELNLAKGINVSGKVRLDEAVTGTALKDMQLKLQLSPRGRTVFRDETSEEAKVQVSPVTGGFVSQNVFPGSYHVYVNGLPKDLAPGKLFYNGVVVGRDNFVMNPGALDQRLEIVLSPARASINVAVEGGKKAADAMLVLRPESYDELDPEQEAQTIKADSEGRGTFAHLLAGNYQLFAFPPDAVWRTDSAYVQHLISGKAVEVANDASPQVEVKLSQVQ